MIQTKKLHFYHCKSHWHTEQKSKVMHIAPLLLLYRSVTTIKDP